MLVINDGSGEVSTFPVFNDGSTEGQFFAALTDRLQITITDPLANVTTSGGGYIVATRAGLIDASARVSGSSLVAQASVSVSLGSTTSLDLALQGAVTTAVVTPADGAVAVSPGVQVEIAAANAIHPDALSGAIVQLLHLGAAAEPPGAGTPVDARLVLSGSGRTLAIVPRARLAANARFRLEAAGLTDVFGGAIVVPPATFVTKADEAPTYDVKQLVVSFPDENGFVTLRGPAGTLPPGSQVLVINNGSGEVSTFPVFNDGSTEGQFFANLTDRLQITITDPLGNVTTFERNSYVREDGMVSVNQGGGIIEGPSGVEACAPKRLSREGGCGCPGTR